MAKSSPTPKKEEKQLHFYDFVAAEDGRQQATREIAANLLALGVSEAIVSQATGLSADALASLGKPESQEP